MIRYIVIVALLFVASIIGMISNSASALKYSAGSYGACTYDTCNITLVSDGSVAIDVTPAGAATRCTLASNSVTATTSSSTGYSVTLNNNDASTTLNGPSANTIPSISGTAASPVALTANTWGYRVDSVANFGAGPTVAVSNAASLDAGLIFAAAPSSAAAGGPIRTTSSSAGSGVATSVWYGICADSTKPAGAYSDSVLYTAVIN